MSTTTVIAAVIAAAIVFILCAVQAARVNSALERELRTERARNADLLTLFDADLRGHAPACVRRYGADYRVTLDIQTGEGMYSFDVKRFPFGDDEGFARREAEELRDKINEA